MAEEAAVLWRRELDWFEELPHNSRNEVTGGVWDVGAGDRRAVVKVMRPGAPVSEWGWPAGLDEGDWCYWRREAAWYESGLARRWLAPAGLDVPELLATFERSDGSVALWLDHVEGRPGNEWTTGEIADLAARWARVQGAVGGPNPRWLARDWPAQYLAHRPDELTAFDDEASWENTPLGRHLERQRAPLRRMWNERELFVEVLRRLPQVLSHHDLWPMNAIRRSSSASTDTTPVLLDWAFVGIGPVGHDAANLVLDTFLDLLVDESRVVEVSDAVTEAYLDAFGGHVDERLVKLGIWASAVKFSWLPLRMASGAVQGDAPHADEDELARRRAPVFDLMWEWSEKTRYEAGRLGWWT